MDSDKSIRAIFRPDDGVECAESGEACAANADCCTGLICGEDGTCEEEEVVECAEAGEACMANADCCDDLVCAEDGTCQAAEEGCESDADCPDDGLYCNGTESCDLTADPALCVSSGDPCAPGLTCNEDTDECAVCFEDSDCGEGEFCVGAECVHCRTDSDCPDGQLCEDNECVPTPPEPCTTDLDCESGEVCDQDSGDCVPAPEGGTRGLPACYEPDVSFTVRIVLNPIDETLVIGLQDFPPSGWAVSEISDDGEWDATNGAVKWFFLDDQTRTLTYTVTPPTDTAENACFVGQLNADGGTDQDVVGGECIETCPGG